MLTNSHQQAVDSEYRLIMLKIIKYCLERYKQKPEEYYLEFYRQFYQHLEKIK